MVDYLKEFDGGYSDLFLKLKKQRDFQRLSRKHGLDDPATWPTLRKTIVLKLADLQGDFSQAESMMATEDRQGGLNNQVLSAEKTREKGRQLHARLAWQMDELRQMLRLIDEMKAVLEEVSREHALTEETDIENKAGQSFPGQVLLVDAKDLIVKSQADAYFRIPSKLLSENTRLTIFNQIFSRWEALPRQDLAFKSGDTAKLIAYDDDKLYFESPEGAVSLARPDDEFALVTYAAQLEAAREALSGGTRAEKESLQAEVNELEAALSLNQSRIAEINWYEARLGIKVPQSEQLELKLADE